MRRKDFEHVLAAAANVIETDEFVVIGSQAILGSFPDAPEDLLRSPLWWPTHTHLLTPPGPRK